MLTPEQFGRARALALRLAGIQLLDRHGEFLSRRLCRLGISGGPGLEPLLAAAEEGEPRAKQQFLALVTTSHTSFFRHPWHFDITAEQALWAAHRRGQARLWSAAAATGEEPYSLAMALIEVFRPQIPPATILATDISQAALSAAETGEYSERTVLGLDQGRRERFFRPGRVAGRRAIAPEVRRLVTFRLCNLAGEEWPIEGTFDVILCRNVLLYLETSTREKVLQRMAQLLVPDGVLLLDPTEHLGKAGGLFSPQADGVYGRRRPVAATPKPNRTCAHAKRIKP